MKKRNQNKRKQKEAFAILVSNTKKYKTKKASTFLGRGIKKWQT